MYQKSKDRPTGQRVYFTQSTSRIPFHESNSLILKMKAHVLNDSYLFIGSGEESIENLPPDLSNVNLNDIIDKLRLGFTPVTLPIAKEDYQPIIPGSSLKGSIRQRIEHLFVFNVAKNFIHSCFINQSRGFIKIDDYNRRFINIYGIDGQIQERGRDQPPNKVCIVCDLFGAPSLASRISFSDAYPVETIELVEITIEEGAKIFCVPPDTDFRFQVNIINHKMEQTGLLLKGMNILQQRPILLGQFKYIKNKVKDESNFFGRVQFSLEKVRENSIIQGKVQSKTLDNAKFIREAIGETDKKFQGSLRDIDEAQELEEIWRQKSDN